MIRRSQSGLFPIKSRDLVTMSVEVPFVNANHAEQTKNITWKICMALSIKIFCFYPIEISVCCRWTTFDWRNNTKYMCAIMCFVIRSIFFSLVFVVIQTHTLFVLCVILVWADPFFPSTSSLLSASNNATLCTAKHCNAQPNAVYVETVTNNTSHWMTGADTKSIPYATNTNKSHRTPTPPRLVAIQWK